MSPIKERYNKFLSVVRQFLYGGEKVTTLHTEEDKIGLDLLRSKYEKSADKAFNNRNYTGDMEYLVSSALLRDTRESLTMSRKFIWVNAKRGHIRNQSRLVRDYIHNGGTNEERPEN